MNIRAILLASTVAAFAQIAVANSPPLSGAWNIAPSGTASSSGELLFRVLPGDGGDAMEITVAVSAGTNDTGVARSIRRALSTQLRSDRFNVEVGVGANVMVTSAGNAEFSIELVDSDVEDLRVAVRSTEPVLPPAVPGQFIPPDPVTPATPSGPGGALPPDPVPGNSVSAEKGRTAP
jgi:hypothetical protein